MIGQENVFLTFLDVLLSFNMESFPHQRKNRFRPESHQMPDAFCPVQVYLYQNKKYNNRCIGIKDEKNWY